MKKDKKFTAFVTDLAQVMKNHEINDLLIVFPLNGQIRNTNIGLTGENELFSFLSDGIDAWLKEKIK